MATIQFSVEIPAGDHRLRLFKWENVTKDDVCAALGPEWAPWADRSVQAAGTFDAGELAWQGSNDGTNWATLTTPAGTDAKLSAAGLKQVLDAALNSKPVLTGAGVSADITVTVFARQPTHGRM